MSGVADASAQAVCIDRVTHCLSCGRCHYFRPFCGGGRCPYCDCPSSRGAGDEGDAMDADSEAWRDACQLASEGFWGH